MFYSVIFGFHPLHASLGVMSNTLDMGHLFIKYKAVVDTSSAEYVNGTFISFYILIAISAIYLFFVEVVRVQAFKTIPNLLKCI